VIITAFSPAQRGFTLLELLLAMTLGALIVAGVGRFLSQSFSLARTQEETASTLADLGRLSAKLGKALRSAQLKEGREDLFFLAGDDGTLLFTTKVGRELKLVGWTVLEDELYYLEDELALSLPEGDLPSSSLLVELGAKPAGSLTEVGLRLFDGELWQDLWDSRLGGALPLAVELSYTTSHRQSLIIWLPQGGEQG
jgi:prepilin-type N-terminal cleavage/methylation domain-containing protein